MSDEYALPPALTRLFDMSAPYSRAATEAITARRAAMPEQRLFFDRLLAFAEVDGPTLYPPTSPSGFRRLLSAIHTASVDRLKRDCFVYYLVRDADAGDASTADMDVDNDDGASTSSSSSRAAAFARRRCLPRPWRLLIDGYWYLDHGAWSEGIAALCDPALEDVNFVPEIVGALTTLVAPPSQALALVHALLAAHPGTTPAEASAGLLATASVAGLSAAFRDIREMGAGAPAAREAVWCWALGAPRTPAGAGKHTAQPRALSQLLHLPLTGDEHAQLVSLLAHPPRDITPAARSLLHDLVTLRLIHAGMYEETLALDKELAGTDGAAAADRQRRREMVREFIDILPQAQRKILLGNERANGHADVDMAASEWVHVERPDAPAPAAPAVIPAARTLAPPQTAASTTPASAPPATVAAPTPVRAFRPLNGTPARSASPFGGPPRFAASPRPPASTASASAAESSRSVSPIRSPVQPATPHRPSPPSPPAPVAAPVAALRSPPRHSSSPFQPPAPKPAPKPKVAKRIIDDEPKKPKGTAKATPKATPKATSRATPKPAVRRSTRLSSIEPETGALAARAPSEPPIPEDAPAATPPRRSRRSKAKEPEATPEPELVQPTPRRVSRGRVSRASTADVDDDMPPPPVPGVGSFSPPPTPRTRAAARHADEPEPKRAKGKGKEKEVEATPRRTTRAMSEMTDVTDDGQGTPAPRRSSRRTAASDRGSPTPSVGSVASPRRKTRGASATPRVTRSKK